MIVTDKFVYVHFPKTGGTFVDKVLHELYSKRAPYGWKEWINRGFVNVFSQKKKVIFESLYFNRYDDFLKTIGGQHGGCGYIREQDKGKPIISNIRNPFEKYVSLYHYRWWEKNHKAPIDEIKKIHPQFPDLSFSEYLQFMNGIECEYEMRGYEGDYDLGFQAIKFVKFFFKDPKLFFENEKQYNSCDPKYLRSLMYDVKFLRAESLNEDLYEMLIDLGVKPTRAKFILNKGKILPKGGRRRKPGDNFEDYYTTDLIEFVREKEKLLFLLFPWYSISIK